MAEKNQTPGHAAHLTLLALGVVFGDIGTSPLYALRQCLQDLNGLPADPLNVLGILSLIFWSLILVVCIKYLSFIFWADHEGEGGILALLALIHSKHPARRVAAPGALILMVLFGAALLYGDGVITPAISVLSAVEGLKLALPATQPFIVPLAMAILIGLFLAQRWGTGGVGGCFGPIMLIWFVAIALLGIGGIVRAPQVLAALNPWEAVRFLGSHGGTGLLVLGGVVLCFSGAEALFADLSHFGRFPIQAAWYALVLPSLLLSYFGQGAFLLKQPGRAHDVFFALVPPWALYPVIGLSTAATVIASQALISGAFSLTEQAIHMGYLPPFNIRHTSKKDRGQVYIRFINYALMIACLGIILGFRSSARLGNAYGLAVIGTMTITSLTYFVVLRRVRGTSWPVAGLLVGSFLALDLSFLAGNLAKILSGAWVPLLLACLMFAIFWIWTEGQVRFRRELAKQAMPIGEFLAEMKRWKRRDKDTGVFLTHDAENVPLIGKSEWLRHHMRSAQVILMTVLDQPVPYVAKDKVCQVEQLGPDFFRITANFGFMQHPDLAHILQHQPDRDLRIDWDYLVFYLPQATLSNRGNWWSQAVLETYEFFRRNSLGLADYFRIPPRQRVYVSVTLKI